MSIIFGWDAKDKSGIGGIVLLEGIKGSSLSFLVSLEEEESITAVFEDFFNSFVVEGDDFCVGDKECNKKEEDLHGCWF